MRAHDAHYPGSKASIVGTALEELLRVIADLKKEGLIASEGRDIHMVDQARSEKHAHH